MPKTTDSCAPSLPLKRASRSTSNWLRLLTSFPELPGWQDRSRFITQEAVTSFYHYDFYAQALSKIERGHAQDLKDVNTLLHTGLIESSRLRELFEAIFPHLYRFPAIDPDSFRRALEAILAEPRD